MTIAADPWKELFVGSLVEAAPDVDGFIARQRRANAESVNLVASESYCPRATLEAEASVLVNKNASGYPPRVSFAGGEVIDRIENLALERAKRLFGAEHANVQALSSTVANVAVLRALLARGERIFAFDRGAGGHSSHGSARHVSGQDYEVRWFGVDAQSGRIDYDAAAKAAAEFRPRMIIAGSSAYPLRIDFDRLADIAEGCGAMLFADIAHVSGLIVAGLHPNPTARCDLVTTSTHKTLCGPRTGGLILCKSRHAAAIDAALAPGLQAAPGAHIIAARAVLFDLVSRPAFGLLMHRVVEGAQALAEGLAQGGAALYAGGTDTHMVVVDLRRSAWPEAEVNRFLENHGIVANTTSLPRRAGDTGILGLRVGSTPMAIRGLSVQGFRDLGKQVAALLGRGPAGAPDRGVAARMKALALQHPIPFE